MSTVFEPLTKAQREQQEKDYLTYIKERDGFPDVHQRTLAKREEVYAAYRANPVTYDGPVPVDEFWEIYNSHGKKASPQSSRMALWMNVLARVNSGEKYGVDLGVRRYGKEQPNYEDPLTYLEMEEFYHTHILFDALRVVGVNVSYERPKGMMKWFVFVISTIPKFFALPAILMAEIVATMVFLRLWKDAQALFGTTSEAGRRIVWLVEQILLDEIGHIAYAQSKLGPVRLAITKLLMPITAYIMVRMDRSLATLYDAKEIAHEAATFRWDYLPPEIRTKAFTPVQARVPAAPAAAAAAA